jgi:cytochrome c5
MTFAKELDMKWKFWKVTAAAVLSLALAGPAAQAAKHSPGAAKQQAPNMPYVFEMYCLMCHKQGVQIGPIGIFDMMAKTGNPLNEQYIRNNVRFGMKAMPAFRLSEVSPKNLDSIVWYLKEVAAYRKLHPEYKPAPASTREARK